MPIAFNFKICDNAPECNGIEVCPVKAITWNSKKNQLEVDNKKCIACGQCAKSCPVPGAICVARNVEEYKECLRKIEEHPGSRIEFLKERCGAAPTDPGINLTKDNFDLEVLQSDRLVLVDFWDAEHLKCRVFSIKFEDLAPQQIVLPELGGVPGLKAKFRKVDVKENPDLTKQYKVKEVPTLLMFYNGKEIGRVDGFVYIDKKDKMTAEIRTALKKVLP